MTFDPESFVAQPNCALHSLRSSKSWEHLHWGVAMLSTTRFHPCSCTSLTKFHSHRNVTKCLDSLRYLYSRSTTFYFGSCYVRSASTILSLGYVMASEIPDEGNTESRVIVMEGAVVCELCLCRRPHFRVATLMLQNCSTKLFVALPNITTVLWGRSVLC